MADPIKLKLTRPIDAHGEKVTELTFNEPTGNDLIAAGAPPFTVEMLDDGSAKPHYDTKAMAILLSRLAVIPPSSVKQLSGADFLSAMYMITNFFLPPPQSESSVSTATTQGSGAAE